MSDLTDFLEARLAEDQEVATASITIVGDTWEASGSVVEIKGQTKGRSVFEWTVCFDEGSPSEEQAEHIARHDPARVLREVAAKRDILKLHGGSHECSTFDRDGDVDNCTWCLGPEECSTILALAAVYSDHESYRKEWAA